MSPRAPKRIVIAADAVREGCATIDGPDFHHLVRVMRLPAGAPVICADGAGTSYHGVIESVDSVAQKATIRLAEPLPSAEPKSHSLTLIHGLARNERTEWILQKGTELGVDHFLPAICERSVVRPTDGERKAMRWREIVRQAARQCERLDVPEVVPPVKLAAALEQAKGAAALKLFGWQGGRPLWELLQSAPKPDSVALVVGPEGGFSDAERQLLDSAGFTAVSVGARVLRSETAAVAFTAIISLWLEQS